MVGGPEHQVVAQEHVQRHVIGGQEEARGKHLRGEQRTVKRIGCNASYSVIQSIIIQLFQLKLLF